MSPVFIRTMRGDCSAGMLAAIIRVSSSVVLGFVVDNPRDFPGGTVATHIGDIIQPGLQDAACIT